MKNFCGSVLIKNHIVVFVPCTAVKWISFCNHRNRNVVGGKHNILVLYVNTSAPNPSGAALCNPFKWDILLFILIKNLVFVCLLCAYHISKTILFPQPHEQKVVGGKLNALLHYVDVCAPDPSGVLSSATLSYEIFCDSSLIKNLVVCVPSTTAKWILIPQPQE